jgi:hypothetical protein
MLKRSLIALLLASGMAMSAMAAEIIVRVNPPRAHRENRGRAPQRGYVYQPGYQNWDGNRHNWVGGHWEAPPRPGARWEAHRWNRRGNGWVLVEGHWR